MIFVNCHIIECHKKKKEAFIIKDKGGVVLVRNDTMLYELV